MIKKYYIEEEDGKEIKRKQTVHEFEDWKDLPHKEQVALVYELSAKMSQQAQIINKMVDTIEIKDKEDVLSLQDTIGNLATVKEIL